MSARHLIAGFFLLILSLQWIGGVVYMKLSYSSWVDWEMDEAELIVARQIEEEYGVRAQVKILSEEEQEQVLSMGYGTPFLFSTSDADQTDYYTLDGDRPQQLTSEVLIGGPEQHEQEGKAILSLDKLFSPYIINNAVIPQPTEIIPTDLANFAYQSLRDLFQVQVPNPPPPALPAGKPYLA